MHTAIGERLSSSRDGMITAGALAVLVVAADLTLVQWGGYPIGTEGRGVVAIFALAANVWLVQGHLPSLGFRLTPVQGWWYWVRVTLFIGLAVLACIVVGLGAWVLSGAVQSTTAPRDVSLIPGHVRIRPDSRGDDVPTRHACQPFCSARESYRGQWPRVRRPSFAYRTQAENLISFFLAQAYLKSAALLFSIAARAIFVP